MTHCNMPMTFSDTLFHVPEVTLVLIVIAVRLCVLCTFIVTADCITVPEKKFLVFFWYFFTVFNYSVF